MKTIKYLIVDDEPLAHKSLEVLLNNYEQIEKMGNCYNAFKAITFIKENNPDLLFLDMDMPDLNGIELLKNINQPIKVVITTAHPSYAIDGYEFGVIDFLSKPITTERLFKTMIKIMDTFSNMEEVEKSKQKNAQKEFDYIFGTADKKIFEKIYFNDITYIEKKGNYLYIHTTEGKSYFHLTSLKSIIGILPSEEFTLVNQSVIISKSKADCTDGKNVVINDEIVFKVSPSYSKNVL